MKGLYQELEREFDQNERNNEHMNKHLTSLNAQYDEQLTTLHLLNLTTQQQT